MKKEFDDDAFSQRRIFFYNAALDKVCQMELFVPGTKSMLKFADESYVIADKAQSAVKEAETVDDNEDGVEDKGFGSGLKGVSVAGAKAKEKAKESELTFVEKNAIERAEKQRKEVTQALEELKSRYEVDVSENEDGLRYQVHEVDAPMVLLNVTRVREKDDNRVVFNDLKARGTFRKLANISYDRFDAALATLKNDHPLFEEVIAFVHTSLSMCNSRGLPQCMPAMLLAGPPGLGKTHFTKALARVMGAACHELSFDANLKASALMGQDKGWSNNTAGIVYDAVIGGDCANPVILLDEIDKCREGLYQHPLSSLHSLLEPVSSSKVTDISIGLTFDASLVTWICTCNYVELVPATLLSRMKVFHIRPATDAALAIRMARVMLEKTHALVGMGLPNFAAPSPKLAPLIAHLSPREQRQELEHAYAIAVAAGRKALQASDFAHLDGDEKPVTKTNLLH